MSKLIIDSRISDGYHSNFTARIDSTVFQRASRLTLREASISKPMLNMTSRNNSCKIRFEQFFTGAGNFPFTTDLRVASENYDFLSLPRFHAAFSDAIRAALERYVEYLDSQGQQNSFHRQNIQTFSQYQVNLMVTNANPYTDSVAVSMTNLNTTAIGVHPHTPTAYTVLMTLLDDNEVNNDVTEVSPASFVPRKDGLLGFIGWYENRTIKLFENSTDFTEAALQHPFKPIRTMLVHSEEIRQAASEKIISNSSTSNKKISNSVIAVINIDDNDGQIVNRQFNHDQYVFDVTNRGNIFSTNIDITITDINGNILDSELNDITQLIFDIM